MACSDEEKPRRTTMKNGLRQKRERQRERENNGKKRESGDFKRRKRERRKCPEITGRSG